MSLINRDNKNRTEERPKRVPVSGSRNIMSLEYQNPDYRYRWVNDIDGRIKRFQDGGWDNVTDAQMQIGDKKVDSSKGTSSVVSKAVGGNVVAYLMRIKREWFDEDKKAKEARVDAGEESMKRQINNVEGSYGNVTLK